MLLASIALLRHLQHDLYFHATVFIRMLTYPLCSAPYIHVLSNLWSTKTRIALEINMGTSQNLLQRSVSKCTFDMRNLTLFWFAEKISGRVMSAWS